MYSALSIPIKSGWVRLVLLVAILLLPALACGGQETLIPTPVPTNPERVDDEARTAPCQLSDPFTLYAENPLKAQESGAYDDDPGARLVLEAFGGDFDNLHALGLISDPFVMFEDGRYKMWFTGLKHVQGELDDVGETQDGETLIQGVAYSESDDGILWQDTKVAETGMTLVLEPTPGGWDRFGIETVTVVKNPDNGQYMMYYAGHITPSGAYHIGLAFSEDGIHWEKHPEPVLKPMYDWEKAHVMPESHPEGGRLSGGVLEPTVIYDEGVFKMWYATLGLEDGQSFSTWGGRIGYATSIDGIAWERSKEPVFVMGEADAWDSDWVSHSHVIQDPVEGYHLFYAGEAGDKGTYGIGHAYSSDGIDWERNPVNPIVANDKSAWNSEMTGGPSALFKDDRLYLWFFGSKRDDFSHVYFGLATAECQ